MRRIPCIIIITLIALSTLGAGCTSPAANEKGWLTPVVTPGAALVTQRAPDINPRTVPAGQSDQAMLVLLTRIEGRVNRSLEILDRNVSSAAKMLGDTGISGSPADNVLGALASFPTVVDAVTVTTDGKIAAVMPAGYQHIVGDNIRDQPHIRKGLSTGGPGLSDEFKTVEGFNASAIVYPVRSANGTVLGLLSVPFLPEKLLSDAIVPVMDNSPYEVTVIQTDGRVIYATNRSQVGMDSLSEPLFISRPDLILFINKVLSADSGSGTYSVTDSRTNRNGTVENYWTTVSLHGTRWKVIIDTIRE
jgi:hypothetical protein